MSPMLNTMSVKRRTKVFTRQVTHSATTVKVALIVNNVITAQCARPVRVAHTVIAAIGVQIVYAAVGATNAHDAQAAQNARNVTCASSVQTYPIASSCTATSNSQSSSAEHS